MFYITSEFILEVSKYCQTADLKLVLHKHGPVTTASLYVEMLSKGTKRSAVW